MMMQIHWWNDLTDAVIFFFKNPLLYWVILLAYSLHKKQQKTEMKRYGDTVTPSFHTFRNTGIIALISFICLSFTAVGLGLNVTSEVIYLLNIITILLGFIYQFKLLSASFTIGITYLLLYPSLTNHYANDNSMLISLTLFIGIFLIVEAILLYRTEPHDYFPKKVMSNRGAIMGTYTLKKASFIPFFMLVPGGDWTPIWPMFTVGETTYQLVLIPFIIGFHYETIGNTPNKMTKKLAAQTGALGFIVMIGGLLEGYYPHISLAAVLIAIVGAMMIRLQAQKKTQKEPVIFSLTNEPIVLWVKKDSPADKMGITIGDTILHINNKDIKSKAEIDSILQQEMEVCTIQLKNHDEKIKTIHVPSHFNNLEQLGILLL